MLDEDRRNVLLALINQGILRDRRGKQDETAGWKGQTETTYQSEGDSENSLKNNAESTLRWLASPVAGTARDSHAFAEQYSN